MLQIISREPENVKTNLLEINRLINKFQVDFEGRKVSVFGDPEFRKRWAEILDKQSQQPNGRRIFMQVYPHPVIGLLRVAKWLPKRNICQQDQEFLTMLADDLRYNNELFVVENGPFEGHYQKVQEVELFHEQATKLSIPLNDSGFCPNCSGNTTKTDGSDPDFVEVVEDDFTDSDTDYRTWIEQNAKKNERPTSTQVEGTSAPAPSLDASSIASDSLEKRKFLTTKSTDTTALIVHKS